ncbi:MAG: hypothetical protein J3T61_10335, partial [Candidatus Brocadiales bacterium]|nr:hypothetical protein [Candidatus Bathyanammoxibius sp.]
MFLAPHRALDARLTRKVDAALGVAHEEFLGGTARGGSAARLAPGQMGPNEAPDKVQDNEADNSVEQRPGEHDPLTLSRGPNECQRAAEAFPE